MSKRGKPPGGNLYRLGYERAARLIEDRVYCAGCKQQVWVLDDGGIIIRDHTETRFDRPPDHALIGVFDNGAQLLYYAIPHPKMPV